MAGNEALGRIVVRIGASHPELRAALLPLPTRARAERLRQLALLGLHCLRASTPIPTVPPEPPATPDVTARRARLMRSLGIDSE